MYIRLSMCACACLCVCVSVDLLTSYESSPITSTTPSLSWVLQRICPGADMAVQFFHLTKSCAGNSSHANDHPFCGVASFKLKHLDGSDPGSLLNVLKCPKYKSDKISEPFPNGLMIVYHVLPCLAMCYHVLPCFTHMKSQISQPPGPPKNPPGGALSAMEQAISVAAASTSGHFSSA